MYFIIWSVTSAKIDSADWGNAWYNVVRHYTCPNGHKYTMVAKQSRYNVFLRRKGDYDLKQAREEALRKT